MNGLKIMGITAGIVIVILGVVFLSTPKAGDEYYEEQFQKSLQEREEKEKLAEQTESETQISIYLPPTQASPPIITPNLHILPLMPIPPYMINRQGESSEEYEQKKAKFDEEHRIYEEKLEKYNEAIKKYTVSASQTVNYGGMTFNTEGLESTIHELINDERINHNLNPLDYDYRISDIARDHSSDMSLNNYFAHEDLTGRDSEGRGRTHGYPECGDKESIQLITEYYKLLSNFEATGKYRYYDV